MSENTPQFVRIKCVETLVPICVEWDCLEGMKDGVCGELDWNGSSAIRNKTNSMSKGFPVSV